jgi:uncharacterized protein (DUF1015 family)
MNLVKAMRAHLGMCFLIYDDPERRAMAALEAAVAGSGPLLELRLPDGEVDRVRACRDPGAIAAVRAAMAATTCVIADGHHRYETAVAFRRDTEAAGPARPGYRYRLASFVNVAEPGLTVLPTHRLIPHAPTSAAAGEGGGEALAALVRAAEPWFQVETLPASDTPPSVRLVELEADAAPGSFVVLGRGGAAARLRLRPNVDPDAVLCDVPAAVRRLDLTLLHALWLERGLGIRSGESEHALAYIRHPEDGLSRVAEGRFDALVLVRPTPVGEVIRVARAGATMPQKSTDFFPKLLSGLLMYDLEDGPPHA